MTYLISPLAMKGNGSFCLIRLLAGVGARIYRGCASTRSRRWDSPPRLVLRDFPELFARIRRSESSTYAARILLQLLLRVIINFVSVSPEARMRVICVYLLPAEPFS